MKTPDLLLARLAALDTAGPPPDDATRRAVVCALAGHSPVTAFDDAGTATCARCGGLVEPPPESAVIVAGCDCADCAARRGALDPAALFLLP